MLTLRWYRLEHDAGDFSEDAKALKFENLHPEMQPLLAAKANVPKTLDPKVMRDGWNAYGDAQRQPYPAGMAVRDTIFRLADHAQREIAVRIYRPADAEDFPAVVFYFHGGCFVKGSLESGDVIAAGVAEETNCVVISVDYRLAPEHPFPAAPEDCYSVVRHVAANARSLGVDGDRLAVWGDSAGGNLAAAVCLMARDRGGPAIAAQALNYPCLNDELTAETYRLYADSPGLRTAYMDHCWGLYIADGRPTGHEYACPVKAKTLAGLPPAHIHIAEYDILADDGRLYAERLRQAGGAVELACANRMIHGFLRARRNGPDSAVEFSKPCNFLRRHLTKMSASERHKAGSAR